MLGRRYRISLLFWIFLTVLGCSGNRLAPMPEIASYRAIDEEKLLSGFLNPPLEAGPWVYWFWFDNAVVESEVRNELREMKEAGIAGVEIRIVKTTWKSEATRQQEFDKANHQPLAYLEGPHLKVLEAACDEAEKLGMKVAFNLGMGWPAGGTWIPDKYKSRRLVTQKHQLTGPLAMRGAQALAVPADSFVLAWKKTSKDSAEVLPETFVNLESNLSGTSQKKLEWDVPAGEWVIGVFQRDYGGPLDKADGFPVDPGSSEAVRFHLDYLFDRLNPVLEKYYGRTLLEIASDSWEYDGRPYWTQELPGAFEKKTGKSLLPQMYALLDLGPKQAPIRAEMAGAESDLVRDNFFSTVTQYVNKLGLRHKPQPYGRGLNRDLFAAYAAADIPEAEQGRLISESVWAARTLGKPISSMEAFTFLTRGDEQFEETLGLLRREAVDDYASGVNRLQFATFSYSPPAMGLPGWALYAPIHLNRNVTWWRYLPALTSWIRRTQWVLQAGEPVSDVLVYPVPSNPADGPYEQRDASQYPNSPINMVDGANLQNLTHPDFLSVENDYQVRNIFLTAGITTDRELISLEHLIGKGSTLTTRVPVESWPVFREPESRRSTLETFLQHQKSGRIVIDNRSWEQLRDEFRSVNWYPRDGTLRYVHRRIDASEIYVLANTGETVFTGDISFPYPESIPLELDPDSGRSVPLGIYRASTTELEIPFRLAPGDLRILVLRPGAAETHIVKTNLADVEKTNGGFRGSAGRSGGFEAQFADGQVWKTVVVIPPPLEVKGTWMLTAGLSDGVGLSTPFERSLSRLVPWQSLPGLERFAGTLHYQIDFRVPDRFFDESNRVQMHLGDIWTQGEVWVNGMKAGLAWYPPYQVDVTHLLRKGQNRLRVDVTNVLKGYESPYVEEGRPARPNVTHQMGLLGPVRLVATRTLSITRTTEH